jgi:hypothetical protein
LSLRKLKITVREASIIMQQDMKQYTRKNN